MAECQRHSRIFDRLPTLSEPHYPLWKMGIFISQGWCKFKGMIFVNILKVIDHHSPIYIIIRETEMIAFYLICVVSPELNGKAYFITL